jgi:F-box and WD-40 domain protein 1/11
LSIYILLFVDLPEILACLRVSRHWHRIAGDNIIWRGFYYRAGFSIDAHAARQAGLNLQPTLAPPPTPSTPSSPPLSTLSKFAYYLPSYPSSLRTSITSSTTQHSLESDLQLVRRETSASLAPLSLDWKFLYKTRLDIEARLALPDRTPALFKLLGHQDAVYCVEYDGETIITGSRDKSICVWSIRNFKPKLKMTLTGHQASVLCLQFDHTGYMVSGSSDSTVIVWDLTAEPENRMTEVLREHKGGVLDIKMDSKWIVSW